MSKVLFNPTNERMTAFHEGIETVLMPFPDDGHKLKVPDPKANHITNTLGPRGIMVLEYGDEPKENDIAAQGRAANKSFKKKQIIRYNQDNETRQQTHKPYIEPSDIVKGYAKELGVELLQPYILKDEKNEEIAELMKQNKALMAQMAKLIEAQSGTGEPSANEAYKKEYNWLKGSEFKQWVTENKERYPAFPIEIQEHIAAKWGKIFSDEPFPI